MSGRLTCMNPYSSAYSSHSSVPTRGRSKEVQRCTLWEDSYVKSSRSRKWMQGIFCVNFGSVVSTSRPCQSLWCGSCHTSKDEPVFHIHPGNQPQTNPNDEDRILSGWKLRKVDLKRFGSARNGDDLLVSFEFDFCVFWKLFDHEPDIAGNHQDAYGMACIRQVTLDALEQGGLLRQIQQKLRISQNWHRLK